MNHGDTMSLVDEMQLAQSFLPTLCMHIIVKRELSQPLLAAKG